MGPGPTQVSIVGGGNLTTDAALEKAVIKMKWLLFNFGERQQSGELEASLTKWEPGAGQGNERPRLMRELVADVEQLARTWE